MVACSDKTVKEHKVILAKVGSQEITVQDFKLNYEFGYAHLRKTGTNDDAKRQILDLMIAEAILSQEGYRLGLDKSEEIKVRSAQLQSELITEQVFIEKVIKNVSVTDDEVRDAIIRSAVSFKIRFYPANSYNGALYVRNLAKEVGFGEALELIASSSEVGIISPDDFVTPEMTWLDLDPNFLESISALQLGELSKPIPVEDHWFIAEILEIKQSPLSESDIQKKWAQTKNVLERNKANSGASEFVSNMMQPLDVRVDATSFRLLASALWDWFHHEEPKLSLIFSYDSIKDQPFGKLLQEHWDDVLVKKMNGNWTIGDFIQRYHKSRYPLRLEDKVVFTNNLKLNIGLTLRDIEMGKIGHNENVAESDVIIETHQKWMDKWVYRELRSAITDSIMISENEIEVYFSRNRTKFNVGSNGDVDFALVKEWVKSDLKQSKEHELIQQKLSQLKKVIPITINEEEFEKIETLPDSNNQTFLLFKRSTGSFAFPVVDPNWNPNTLY